MIKPISFSSNYTIFKNKCTNENIESINNFAQKNQIKVEAPKENEADTIKLSIPNKLDSEFDSILFLNEISHSKTFSAEA